MNSLLASGEGPVGTGVAAMQRKGAAEKPHKMTPERQEWMLARLSDMPMRGMVSPVTHGGDAIGTPVDYLGVIGDVMEPQHAQARALGWSVEKLGPELDHAFVVGAPEKVLEYLRPKL